MKRRYSQDLQSKSGDIRPRIKDLKIYNLSPLEVLFLNLEMRNNLNIPNRNDNIGEPKKIYFK